MKIRFLAGINALLLFLFLTSMVEAAAIPQVYFDMKDALGDENGYGTYHYPTNVAFKPYQGLFDITEFKVIPGSKGFIYFDTSFAKITNPWVAPEGFIHENLRIFVNKQPGRGLTTLPYPGANIKFDSNYGWEFGLQIVGWGNSRLLTLEDQHTIRVRTLKVELLQDGTTIRAFVPEQFIGIPQKNWQYYVFVGSYDGFGENFFRKVDSKSGEWVIGGGLGQNLDPRILDLLAPAKGRFCQEKQLRSYNIQAGQMAVLFPAGNAANSWDPITWLFICLVIVFISGVIYLIIKKPRRISWFWIRQDENKSEKIKA
jgi:carbohydrate-binding DOMON domain-containing protein